MTHQPVKITFEDLRFSAQVEDKATKKFCGKSLKTLEILKGCSGSVLPGELTVIMGSSGAGKTSLLNKISDRISEKSGNKMSGKIMVNDSHELNQHVFGEMGAYVMQDDVLFTHFTVEDALIFAARLKLTVSKDQQDKRVKELIEELGLTHVKNTICGGPMLKTISGGERKRTAIGVEMITDPQVLLLDEPTSGLDSFRAFSIVKFMQSLARKGKTVVATIHQPSSDSYLSFDKLILMCDGHIVYQGPPKGVPEHFAKVQIDFPHFKNPADVAMKVLSIPYPKTQKEEVYIKSLVDLYDQELKP